MRNTIFASVFFEAMFRLIILSVTQAILMCGAQSLFKVAIAKWDHFVWTWSFFRDNILANGFLWGAAVAGIAGVVEWLYMLKVFPFSQIYPLTSLSFICAMLIGVFFFHETVVWQQWLGLLLILAGCVLIVK